MLYRDSASAIFGNPTTVAAAAASTTGLFARDTPSWVVCVETVAMTLLKKSRREADRRHKTNEKSFCVRVPATVLCYGLSSFLPLLLS